METFEVPATWTDNCQGKKDYDGDDTFSSHPEVFDDPISAASAWSR